MNKCSYSNICGGCSHLNITYEEELSLKQKYVEDLFKGLNKSFIVNKIVGSKDIFNYRNKGQLTYKKVKGKYLLGMYEEGTHNVLEVEDCLLNDKEINESLKVIKKVLLKYHIEPYDEDKKKGILRHVLVKRSNYTNEILVVLVTSIKEVYGLKNLAKEIIKLKPNITTIIQNINNKNTSIVLGNEEVCLYGPGFIFDNLLGLKFKITSKSFYQINKNQCEVLYKLALEHSNLKEDDLLIDCYAGVGTIGIIASKRVKKVISVELEKASTLCCKDNIKYNKINNVVCINEDATEYLKNYHGEHINTLIMDPPRSGSTELFLNQIINLKIDKVIYISCNPLTQVRDLKILLKYYNVNYIQPVDMFPRTNHVENVVALSLKK